MVTMQVWCHLTNCLEPLQLFLLVQPSNGLPAFHFAVNYKQKLLQLEIILRA